MAAKPAIVHPKPKQAKHNVICAGTWGLQMQSGGPHTLVFFLLAGMLRRTMIFGVVLTLCGLADGTAFTCRAT